MPARRPLEITALNIEFPIFDSVADATQHAPPQVARTTVGFVLVDHDVGRVGRPALEARGVWRAAREGVLGGASVPSAWVRNSLGRGRSARVSAVARLLATQ